MRRQSFYRCTGDWIFWIDDDDVLGSRWTRPLLDHLLAQRSVTHYWIPGRYLVNESGLYLSTAPFIGHFHPQLYRNIESIVVLPSSLHQHPAIAGEPAYLAGVYLDAMDFVWHDRTIREAKIGVYEEVHDEGNTGFDQTRFYLYEDYYYETRQIDDSVAPRIMARIAQTDAEPGVSVRFLDHIEKMTMGQTYWVAVRIVNNSGDALLPQSEFIRWGELKLSYLWFDEALRVHEGRDGVNLRGPFPARILPGYEHDALVRVKAPAEPGSYRLQMDILDKNEASLLDAKAGHREFRAVEVMPLVWPPQPVLNDG
jgi:hypothetical protein